MFYQMTNKAVCEKLGVELGVGLDPSAVKQRLMENGPNALAKEAPVPSWRRFINQFDDVMIFILIGAAAISFFAQEAADGFIILTIVLLNAILGFVQENKAEKSMQALKKMQIPYAQVMRGGVLVKLPSIDLVPGDIVQLNSGDVVPADGRLIETAGLKIEESQLTGESVPVDKNTRVISEDNPPIGDRRNMAFATSRVSAGRGRMVVTQTGMNTEIGQIAGLLSNELEEKTPLQIQLAQLGKMLGIGAVGICAFIFVIGWLQGREVFEMLMIAISLAVAAIPEGLPAIVTIVLAMGVQRMIKGNAIVRKLPAVETLGAASVICSDKTGTLTQNKMTVTHLVIDKRVDVTKIKTLDDRSRMLVETAVYCNDAGLSENEDGTLLVGDPTETALLVMGQLFGISQGDLKAGERKGEVPFDSDRKLMSTFHEHKDGYRVSVKGAADQLLDRCDYLMSSDGVRTLNDEDKTRITDEVKALSKEALRVLGYAYQVVEELPGQMTSETVENGLIFIGLTAMMDPPREEVKDAVAEAQAAGIRVVMITGDYIDTAKAIATELGILSAHDKVLSGAELDALTEEKFLTEIEQIAVYARVSPSHKVRIVKALKEKGKIVAMTGDGVNDAPALKGADIGCAMGITGTDVAKEASDLILTDDNFSTIVMAVKEGRTIYDNIRKAVTFLLSSNIGEIFTLFVAILIGWKAPLLAIHILWINLITDSFPAIALGLEPPEKSLMTQKPRQPEVPILGDGLARMIVLQGVMIGALSLSAFMIGQQTDHITAQTMTFITLSLSQLFHSYNVRSRSLSLFKLGFFTNRYLNLGFLTSLASLLTVYLVPPFREIFKLTLLSGTLFLTCLGLSLLTLVIMESVKLIKR
ncbi:MAG: calcium-translocating P-type ATPase, PMCA-type [Desulfobacterium sp.]|nr:calcium-translocating P-type ATPase, PMCA-type [Desulfobacterium sp.]